MNNEIYTKAGKLRAYAPPRYVFRHNKQVVHDSKLQKVRLAGTTFLLGPNGESLDENPNYKEWLRLRDEIHE